MSPVSSDFTQMLVWPERFPETVTKVTITPDYPSSRHTGLVNGLKKFTWYYGSTLCFTTPGDGPRSPPVLLQTLEDSECTITHPDCHTTETPSASPTDHNEGVMLSSVLNPAVYYAHLCPQYTNTKPSPLQKIILFYFLVSLFLVFHHLHSVHCFVKGNWFICFHACWYL